MDEHGNYSKILWYEVWNFMSIEHAKVEFDEKGIINFKGYNDSGKSTMLRALDVCLLNKHQQSQTRFIRDDASYFRVLVAFSDGVKILKDKYSNGKGLYEMYKGDDLIYSTKQNGVLTKITEIPECIQNYLGMVSSGGIHLNSRSCYDKQLLVDTKGKENYDFLNVVLQSEELSIAGTMLNTDKNKLLSEKQRHEAEYDLYAQNFECMQGITTETVDKLEEADKRLEVLDENADILIGIEDLQKQFVEIPVLPEVNAITTEQLDELTGVEVLKEQLVGLPDIPEVHEVDTECLVLLNSIMESKDSLKDLAEKELSKPLSKVEEDRMALIGAITEQTAERRRLEEQDREITEELARMNVEIEKLKSESADFNHKVLVCKNCGCVMLDDEMHEEGR
jgi:hypothetical protein